MRQHWFHWWLHNPWTLHGYAIMFLTIKLYYRTTVAINTCSVIIWWFQLKSPHRIIDTDRERQRKKWQLNREAITKCQQWMQPTGFWRNVWKMPCAMREGNPVSCPFPLLILWHEVLQQHCVLQPLCPQTNVSEPQHPICSDRRQSAFVVLR